MRQNPERLAWLVLLISFAACVGLVVGVPLTARWYLLYSHTGELVTLDVQEGTLLYTCPGAEETPAGVVNRQQDLCQGREGAQVSTGPSDQGLLSIHPRTPLTATLASVQLYRGTRLRIQEARAPRFPLSAEPHRVVMRIESGRIRVHIPPLLERNVLLQIYTPQALVQVTDGSTYVEVNNQQSQVIVREGQALVVALANNTGVSVNRDQRAVVLTGSGLSDVQPAERNLIADSDLREPMGAVWRSFTADPEIDGESRGSASNVIAERGPVVELARVGTGHAETGIAQEVNRDIRDFRSLQLHIVLRVLQQDVPVCGSQGTECPVMVRIDYVDEGGGTRSWLQGFYYLPDRNLKPNPEFCVTCNPRNPHIRTTSGVWYPYDSPNLIPFFSELGPAPVTLKSVSIYASGHTYQSQIAEIELSGQE